MADEKDQLEVTLFSATQFTTAALMTILSMPDKKGLLQKPEVAA